MDVPCVRVAPEAGEATRSTLADADLIDDEYEIAVDDGWLYIPVADPDAASSLLEDGEIVSRTVAERESQTMPADLLAFDPTYERLGEAALIDEDDPDARGRSRMRSSSRISPSRRY